MTDKAVYGYCRYGYTKYSVVNTVFDDVIAQLEKKNVSENWIDYEWIEAGLADSTPLDDVLARLQK